MLEGICSEILTYGKFLLDRNLVIIFFITQLQSLQSQSYENSSDLKYRNLVQKLLFSGSTYWNDDVDDFEELNDKSISGKGLWEINYNFQKYKIPTLTYLRSNQTLISANFKIILVKKIFR